MDYDFPPTYEDTLSASRSAPYINEGYESDYDISMPPSAPELPTYMEAPQMILSNFQSLKNAEIRNACREYVDDTCCYGTRAIRDMIFSDIYNSCSLHYKLESFTEMRRSAMRNTPYHGQGVDGPENGPVPAPWDMRVTIPNLFQESKSYVKMPHSEYVETCHKCSGSGEVDCWYCNGSGEVSCSSCSGSGRDSEDSSCSSCSGSGKSRCSSCWGSGKEKCSRCDGHGKVKYYRELIVSWKNHVDNFVANTMNLPSECLVTASGEEIFREQNLVVSPILESPDAQVTEISCVFINKHRQSFPNELIRMQRQTIRAIPITRVLYNYKRKQGEFYVYSIEKKVYFEDYPQKCCCCTCC